MSNETKAPQPPAEAQPAAWLGANPRTGVPVMAVRTPAPSVMRDFAMRPLYAHPPPSAPVGVEAVLRDALQGLIDFIEIDNLPMDADAMFIAKRALAQQPAAVDEVHELRLCESSRLHLFPGRLYRFTVDPDCKMCADAASNCDLAQQGGAE